MANFGFRRLTVVTEEQLDWDAGRPLAIGAEPVFDGAKIVRTLRDAIAGSSIVAGVTRRLGKKRKEISYTPWEFAAKVHSMQDAPVSVVFGNERAGLSDEELLLCHLAVAIPTSESCPSLNLSHAVEVIAYELYKAGSASLQRHEPVSAARGRSGLPATVEELESASDTIVESLERLGYHWHGGPRGIRTFLRDLLARAVPTVEETRRFRALFEKLAGMHGAPREREHDNRLVDS